jgi:hypothetical protein
MGSPDGQLFRPCLVVPYFRHENALPLLLDSLRPCGLHCFLVDDGNTGASLERLRELAPAQAAWLEVVTLAPNQGKGAAVHAGCAAAARAGYTHAVQIDADGQHDAGDIPKLLGAAREHPAALVTGIPRYDASVPAVRFYGRYLTHALVWLHTLSFEVRDSMCGFRVYPLASSLALWQRRRIGRRMDFDTDVIVRLHWQGMRVISVPTRVTYPADGVSNFHYLRDNLRMISLHLRLLAGMLLRSPLLIARRLREAFA